MNYFSLFRDRSKFFFVYLGILGITNSIWASALLLLINNKITDTPLPFFNDYDWLIYVVLIVISFAVSAYFQSYMIRLTHNFGNELGLSIFDKLRFSTYENYLSLSEEKVRTALLDVAVLQRFPSVFVESFNSLIMVVIGISYLFWIDELGAALVLVSMILLAVMYTYRNNEIEKDLDAARDLNNVFHQNINDFLRGFKEVKMSITKSDNIYEKYIVKNRFRAMKFRVSALIRHLENELLGNYTMYMMIGVVLFILPLIIAMDTTIKTNFLVTLLFLIGPAAALVGVMESFVRMKVAINRIDEFNEIINRSTNVELGYGDMTEINSYFSNIRFDNVQYDYLDKKRKSPFSLGPINLEITKGETVFVTGGNGSGKSTFINLLSGLYSPKKGGIYLNDHLISQDNIAYYRNQLTAIFTDNYLFSENYDGFDLSKSNQQFMELLHKMGLEDVISIDEEKNKVRHQLSKGQQKRMALIYSMLEDKDIFIFDEWAAEQDPEFRRFFYRSILPELKAMGKTVIAVTHDDAYFDCAERVLKFDFGKIVKDEVLSFSY